MKLNLDRPSRSVHEIEALPALGGSECAGYLQRKGKTLCAETLVFLLREFATLRRSRLFEACGALLVGVPDRAGRYHGGQCESIILSRGKPFGFLQDDELRTEYRGRCHLRMWECITAGRLAKPFWEERFGHALWELCVDVGQSLTAELTRHAIIGSKEAVADPYEIPGADGEDAWISAMNAQDLKRAIRELPDPLRRAAWMRWVADMPITAPEGTSLMSVLGVSDSLIRRRLRHAAAELAKDPKVAALRQDLA
ncbi:MAG TPA: hypothetical protein VF710_23460 [Longimicrobium sp.]|jgi:hypothetical protein